MTVQFATGLRLTLGRGAAGDSVERIMFRKAPVPAAEIRQAGDIARALDSDQTSDQVFVGGREDLAEFHARYLGEYAEPARAS